jgi:anti-sigma factor RsiW
MGEADDKLTATASACVWADAVAAFLDGELAAGETFVFEEHLKSCDSCPLALADQRRLTVLITAAVTGTQKAVILPADFARVVTARAQSDMSSVRRGPETRRAALLALALAAVSLALLGACARGGLLAPATAAARGLAAASEMALHAAGAAAAGALLLLRGIGNFFTQAHPDASTRLLAAAALAAAILLLLRLITKYHRTIRPD